MGASRLAHVEQGHISIFCCKTKGTSQPTSSQGAWEIKKDKKKPECFNPLTPKSDQHLISPHNITPELHIKVLRIKEMITN